MAKSKPKKSSPQGITWKKDTLAYGLDMFTPQLKSKVAVLIDRQADEGTRMMKQGARWTDRTGNARATLKGDAKHMEFEDQIILHGGMPYQIFLETMQGGKFAIIRPTLPELGRKTMAMCQGLMALMR